MASLYEQYLGNNRDYIYNNIGGLALRSRDRGDEAQTARTFYRGAGDDAYIPFLEGRGGYRPGEADEIIGRDRLDEIGQLPNPNDAYLSIDEQQALRGDPGSREKYFNPHGDLDATYGEQGRSRGIADSGIGVANSYSDEARGIADPTKLEQSQDFVDRYRMTPEQVDAAATSAARDSTAVSQAAMMRAREAGTAGGMDPLGMASYLDRANRRARQDAARGASSARVNAQQEQARREFDIEQNRQGAVQTSTGLRQDAAARGYDATGRAITQKLATEESGNARAQQQRQFNTQTGGQIASDQENQRVAANQYITKNRQDVNLRNRDDVYDRQKYRDTQLTGRVAGVADTRRADEREARGYVTGMYSSQQDREQRERDRELQGHVAATGATQNNLQLQQQQDNKPKWWEKLISAGSRAAGAAGALGVGI